METLLRNRLNFQNYFDKLEFVPVSLSDFTQGIY